MTIVILLSFSVLLLLDVPVAFCMVLSSLAALLYNGVNPIMVGLETSRSMASFYPFLAVPFFILAGELMSHGGLSQKIIDFVKALVGHRRAGLPMVTTISSQAFGAISGASNATCAAIGGLMIPAMEKAGYPRAFGSALTACSGTTGALIPPSIVLLIYGTIANVSIEKLFVGGVGPGILIGIGLMTVSWRYAGREHIQAMPKVGMGNVARSAVGAAFALVLIVIIFGGIMGGVFTATEASAIAVAYALFVGFFVYRQLTLRALPKIFLAAARTTATLSFLIACASLFAWTLAVGKVPDALSASLLSGCETIIQPFQETLSPEGFALLHKIVVLMTLNVALLVVGMFIDAGPGLLIVVPVLLPVCRELGMDPVHFGVMVVTNLVIGLVTPPVGTTLFVAGTVGKVEIADMLPHVLRFLGVMIIVQLLVTYCPPITTWLPSFIK